MKRIAICMFALTFGAIVSNVATAEVPALIPVQGVLADASDEPIDDLTDLTFTLYDDAAGTTTLWTDTFVDVDVVDGFFTIYLGSNTALDFASLISNSEIWMGIEVETDGEMDRFQLATVPFAVEAGTCGAVGTLTESDINTNFLSSSYAPAWSDLTGVPSGFSDSTDDVDDSVDWSEIAGVVGTATSTVAAGDHNHDSDYAALAHNHDTTYAPFSHNHDAEYVNEGQADSITSAMITNGTITYSDTNVDSVQRRVTGTCTSEQKVLGINSDGSVSCETDIGGGTLYYHIGPNDFDIAANAAGYDPDCSPSNCAFPAGATWEVYMPTHVPGGATIREVMCRIDDPSGASGAQIDMTVYNGYVPAGATVSSSSIGYENIVFPDDIIVTGGSRGNAIRFNITTGSSSSVNIFYCYVEYDFD